MSLPIANFSYIVNGLEVSFTDTSSDSDGAISAWSWNFGDSNTSIVQNPTHTFASGGIFGVVLQVTEGTDTSTLVRYISLTEIAGVITVPIASMVAAKLPSSILDAQYIFTLIQKYQLLLQEGPINAIPDALVFTETAWPSLYNILISELVVYDIVINKLMDVSLSGGIIGTTTGSSSEESTGSLTQNKKSIETGPTKVEWYDNNQYLAAVAESQANYYKNVFGASAIGAYKLSICMLAKKLGVYLSLCSGFQNSSGFITLATPDEKATINNHFPGYPINSV